MPCSGIVKEKEGERFLNGLKQTTRGKEWKKGDKRGIMRGNDELG